MSRFINFRVAVIRGLYTDYTILTTILTFTVVHSILSRCVTIICVTLHQVAIRLYPITLHYNYCVTLGSAVLHELSLSMDLDFFIMFSSISGILGNVGQVAYAAANTFLDQLCEYRRYKLGLPALSVNWGPIKGAGVLERNTDLTTIFDTIGFYSLHYTTGIYNIVLSETHIAISSLWHKE